MNEELFWAMTAAGIYGITHHPRNHQDGGKIMLPEEAARYADHLLIEYRNRVRSGFFDG